MPEPYSEAQTRQEIIDQRLRLAGWDVDDPSQVIQELDIYVQDGKPAAVRERPREYAGHQFVDYGLVLKGKPAAVVEAKKTSRDARRLREVWREADVSLVRIARPWLVLAQRQRWDERRHLPRPGRLLERVRD